tara:strand:+ start:242 stop:640 length:399 start_codon:yes stop_codon:yes gene_type:complete
MGRVFFDTRKNVHNLTAAYQVLSSDSGKVFTIDQDAAFAITLPATHLEGENYKFIVTDAGSGEVHIDSGASNGIKGFSMDPTTGINAIDNNLVEIVASTAVIGDVVKLVSDGTTWWCESFSSATNGIVGANS